MKNIKHDNIRLAICQHFLYEIREEYISQVKTLFNKISSPINVEMVKSCEWQKNPYINLQQFIDMLSENYGESRNFSSANICFESNIRPLLSLFDKHNIKFLLEQHNDNRQCWYRHGLDEGDLEFNGSDSFVLYQRAKELLGEDFDFSEYDNFSQQIEEYLSEKKDIS